VISVILTTGVTMKKTRFTEFQIVGILNEAEAGMKVADVCRKYGICGPTYYAWKNKYGEEWECLVLKGSKS
jgi:transposase-like protein